MLRVLCLAARSTTPTASTGPTSSISPRRERRDVVAGIARSIGIRRDAAKIEVTTGPGQKEKHRRHCRKPLPLIHHSLAIR
jgi:hypothetical protein